MGAELITAGADLLSTGINAVVQGTTNRKNRQFAKSEARWQRANSLSDYNMQNQYNSPAEQMKRLREAGLNPNLVYGNGATTQAASISPTQGAKSEATAPRVDLGGAVNNYLNAKTQQLQQDNLKAQNIVLQEQAKNIAADTLQKGFGANLKEFDFNFKTDNRNQDIYKKQQTNINLHKQAGMTDASIANTNERTKSEIAMRQPRIDQITQGISESLQRMLTMKIQAAKSTEEINYLMQQINNAQKDGTLKDIDIQLKKKGFTWGDPYYFRVGAKLLNEIGL